MTKEKKLYSIAETLDIIPISVAGIYKCCREGKIPTVRIARRYFIPAWYIDSIVNKPLESEAN